MGIVRGRPQQLKDSEKPLQDKQDYQHLSYHRWYTKAWNHVSQIEHGVTDSELSYLGPAFGFGTSEADLGLSDEHRALGPYD